MKNLVILKRLNGQYNYRLIAQKVLYIMRLTAVLLFVGILQVGAKEAVSQKVTIHRTNASLQQILNDINSQTGLLYSANSEILKSIPLVTIDVDNREVEEVLEYCLKGQLISYSIRNNVIVIAEKRNYFSQNSINSVSNINIRGKVVNENGEPVIVTISVKGTKIATTTTVNGDFILNDINESSILVISGVNIESYEIKVNGQTDLKVIAVKTRVIQGEEVVVGSTGYQMVRANEINGSIQIIDNKTLNLQKGTNILQRLNGIASGLLFNIGKSPGNNNIPSKTGITIRGPSTINAILDPLIVLDNFIYEGNINDINPNDVENITILKDGAATSIYGPQGGNGVIVITTKKGQFNSKTKIDFNSNIIITKKPDLYSLHEISSSDYIDVEQFLFNKGFFNSRINSFTHPALTPAVEVFLQRRNRQISSADSAGQIDLLKSFDSRTGYDKYFYRTGITSQYSVNISGGSNNMSWLFAGAYDKQIGNLKDKNDRMNFHFSNAYTPFKNFTIRLEMYYTSSLQKSGAPSYNSIKVALRNVPYLNFYDNQGNMVSINKDFRGVYTDTVGAGSLLNWKYYPLEDYKHDVSTTRLDQIIGNVGLTYRINKGIDIELLYQYQRQNSNSERYSDEESYYARNMVNRFSQVDRSTGVVNYAIPLGGVKSISGNMIRSQNFRGQINYKRNWGKHSVAAFIGNELRQIISTDNINATVYGYIKNPFSQATVDYTSYYTTILGISETIPGAPIIGFPVTNNYVSFYSNLSYIYRNRYSFSASVRKDASNIFGLNTNDKWNPFWHVGVGWDVTQERFYHSKLFKHLRLKSTWGYSGNVDPRKSALPTLSYSTSPITNYQYAQISGPNDPNLRWEKSGQLNIGVEFASNKSIISGFIEYYIKKGSDLYGPTQYDYTTFGGYVQNINRNIADMKGQGIDLSLTSNNIDKLFKWTTTILGNYNSTQVTKYYSTDANNISTILDGGKRIIPLVGKPLYAIAAYKWGGLDATGDPLGYLNGQLSKNYSSIAAEGRTKGINGNITYIGPATPVYFGSIINNFTWRNISLSVNIGFKFKYYFRKPALSYATLFNNGIGHSEYSSRWKKPGDEFITNVPALVYTNYPQFTNRDIFYQLAEINVLKADNIRIQYVNLSYLLISRHQLTFFNQLQAYANVANLGILWRANKEKYDPDYPSTFVPVTQLTIGCRAIFK